MEIIFDFKSVIIKTKLIYTLHIIILTRKFLEEEDGGGRLKQASA